MIGYRINWDTARECATSVRGGSAETSHHSIQPDAQSLSFIPPLAAAAGGAGNGSGCGVPPGGGGDDGGDIIYGAPAIADYLFPKEPKRRRAERRVYGLWDHYKHYPVDLRAGFFKPKGGLCLSKSKWRKFHGLD